MKHPQPPLPLLSAVIVTVAYILILSSIAAFRQGKSPVFAHSLIASDGPPRGTWSLWPEQVTDADLRDLYLPSPDEGWAVGGRDLQDIQGHVPIILRYAEGHWSVVDDLPAEVRFNGSFSAVDGTGPDNIWVAGKEHRRGVPAQETAALVHYDGVTWRKIALPDTWPLAPFTDINVVSTETNHEVWVISRANARNTSHILHFDGRSWDQESIQNRSLLGIHMLSAEEGQIVSMGAGGAPDGHHYWYYKGSWRGTSVWTPQPLNAVSMAEATYGWAVGNNGATDEYVGQCHTPGTGCSWSARQAVRSMGGAAINPDLWDVQMVSRFEGWIVGEPWNGRSTIAYLTQEPNPTWRVVSVSDDPGKILYGVAMLAGADGHAVEGWAVGASGVILGYTAPAPQNTDTPTATVTPTSTPGPSPSSVPTGIETSTPSTTPVLTASATRTPSQTGTATATAGVTLTRQSAPTRTPTLTASATSGVKATATPTPQPTSTTLRPLIFLPLVARQSEAGG